MVGFSQAEHSEGVLHFCLFCINLFLVFLEDHRSHACLDMNLPVLGTSTVLFLTVPGVLWPFWPSDGQVCICLLQGTWRAIFDSGLGENVEGGV